jgi:predicted AlkP superfamily phosphohydrolase/phosphomutase
MSEPNYRVLILGLDGATFDLMLPYVEQGLLPCLGKLLKDGAWSPLRSTVPPITPCAWSSFMTGKNPGKHGLFDFVEPLPGGHGFRFTNASSRQAESLWSFLSRHGRRVGVINVPMTYPPERVNGYMISGLDTPLEQSPYIYPTDIRREVLGLGYRIDLRHLGNMRTRKRRDRRFRDLLDIESVRTTTLKHLEKRFPADFRMLVYAATDQVQHHFWQYMDPKHDKYDAKDADRYRHCIRDTYIHLDREIASILEGEDERTIVLIMSDHGFGPCTNVRIRANQIFERNGLLSFQQERGGGRAVRGLAGLMDRVLRSTLPARTKTLIAGLFPRLRVWFETLDEARVDWSHTTAYVNEVSRHFPVIWLNHIANAADGTVTPEKLDETLRATEQALLNLKDPETGGKVVSNVYRTRDLYHGPCAAKAPDLLPSWWEDGFLFEQSTPGGPAALDVEHSREPVKGGVEFAASHRMDGVFMIAGGPTRGGHAFQGAEIIDVAPTVLYLMGLPIPGDMDGRPLLDAIDPTFVADHPPQYDRDGAPPEQGLPQQETVFSEEEAEMITKRLQSMGYIE